MMNDGYVKIPKTNSLLQLSNQLKKDKEVLLRSTLLDWFNNFYEMLITGKFDHLINQTVNQIEESPGITKIALLFYSSSNDHSEVYPMPKNLKYKDIKSFTDFSRYPAMKQFRRKIVYDSSPINNCYLQLKGYPDVGVYFLIDLEYDVDLDGCCVLI